jgi:hypothetical protein
MASPRSRKPEQARRLPTEKWTRRPAASTVGTVTSESPTLHVRAASRGGWLVVDEDHDAAAPLSEHPDATAALRAGLEELRARGGDGEVLVHDRYHRVRRRITARPR